MIFSLILASILWYRLIWPPDSNSLIAFPQPFQPKRYWLKLDCISLVITEHQEHCTISSRKGSLACTESHSAEPKDPKREESIGRSFRLTKWSNYATIWEVSYCTANHIIPSALFSSDLAELLSPPSGTGRSTLLASQWKQQHHPSPNNPASKVSSFAMSIQQYTTWSRGPLRVLAAHPCIEIHIDWCGCCHISCWSIVLLRSITALIMATSQDAIEAIKWYVSGGSPPDHRGLGAGAPKGNLLVISGLYWGHITLSNLIMIIKTKTRVYFWSRSTLLMDWCNSVKNKASLSECISRICKLSKCITHYLWSM